MPPAVVAVAATIGAEYAVALATSQAFALTTAVLVRAAFAAGMALVGEALARPNAPAQAPAFQSEARGRTHIIRASADPRRVIYGKVAASGTLVYGTSSGTKNEYLHLVIAIAGHRVEEIGDVYLNDEKLGTLDGAGNVTSGRFAGFVRVKKYLGDPDQAADPDLIAEAPNNEWTSAHRLRGIAYLYLRLKWDQSVFPTGIPNPKCVVKGKNDILDPRTGLTGYTTNAALCALDYIRWQYGFDCSASEYDSTTWIAAANVCDEDVFAKPATSITSSAAGNPAPVAAPAHKLRTGDTAVIAGHAQAALNGTHVVTVVDDNNLTVPVNLAAGGTGGTVQLQQKRYACNGSFTLDQEPPKVLEDLRSATGGACIWAMGKWYGYAGAAATPTVTLTEKDLRAPLKWRPRPSRQVLFNAVRGTYVNAHDYWQQTDFPPITNSAYEQQDNNKRIYRDIQLPFTTDVYAAQRLGRIELERHRAGRIMVDFPAKITALRQFVWRGVYLNITELGWNQKPFRVTKWKLAEDGGVDLVLESFASTIYDWTSSNAQLVTPPRDTTLPNPLNVAAPGAPVVTEELYETRGSAGVKARINLSCTLAQDAYVKDYQFEYKLSSASAWNVIPPSTATGVTIEDAAPGTYDFRVKAINTLGVPSNYSTLSGKEIFGLAAAPVTPQNLTISAIGGLAILRWGRHPDLDVRIGGKFEFRYSPLLVGATLASATGIGEAAPGGDTVGVLPLKSGTYFAIAVDSSGIPSAAASVTTKGATVLAYANLSSLTESTAWPGTHSGTAGIDDVLKLKGAANIDSIANIDGVPNWDAMGGVGASGTYTFSGGIDLGSVKRARLKAAITSQVLNAMDRIDSRTGLIDDWADFDGGIGTQADARVYVRETDDDPNGTPTWLAWQRLDSAEFQARAFQFQAQLTSSDPTYNIHVSGLTVTAEEVL